MIKVVSYDSLQKIITIDVNGQQTQADVPDNLYTQDLFVSWMATIVQPVVDSMIRTAIFDPNSLIQMGDLTSAAGLLTAEELAALAALFPQK